MDLESIAQKPKMALFILSHSYNCVSTASSSNNIIQLRLPIFLSITFFLSLHFIPHLRGVSCRRARS
ncbi:hypothetical protein Y032_0050g2022 [Ancylostoma ceylanicum]|uniref:Uncharacterized protein n=1 Tax=Ancylostoma ceylanicum TaxID=53326 RepID=A0A016U9P2_9BILA|nr:hypothetical protein Y032_0050g2022 [Ancylostoma ceylanicum]